MAWLRSATADGTAYWYDDATFEVRWDAPEAAGGAAAASTTTAAASTTTAAAAPNDAGVVLNKINATLEYMPLCMRCWCAPCVRCLSARPPSLRSPVGIFRLVFGAVVYGVLFLPFVFALLQQSAMDRSAVDPFHPSQTLSRRSWLAAYVFLFAVSLYVLVAFTALPDSWYAPGEPRLAIVLTAVLAVVWVQQGLTFRYILLRGPELNRLRKDEGAQHKHQLCGRAYSTLDPKKPVNYVYMAVVPTRALSPHPVPPALSRSLTRARRPASACAAQVLSEFFVLASVCFHQSIPWTTSGARLSDRPTVRGLQAFFPQFLSGLLADDSAVVLSLLLTVVLGYILLLGHIVQSQYPPTHLLFAVASDLIAGACYATIVGRLLLCAFSLPREARGARVIAMLGLFGFSTTAVFVATMRGDAGRRLSATSDVRFMPK